MAMASPSCSRALMSLYLSRAVFFSHADVHVRRRVVVTRTSLGRRMGGGDFGLSPLSLRNSATNSHSGAAQLLASLCSLRGLSCVTHTVSPSSDTMCDQAPTTCGTSATDSSPATSSGTYTSLRLAIANKHNARSLILPPGAPELVCSNMMCAHVGDACSCRLAVAIEKLPNLHTLVVANNQLRTLPDTILKHKALRTVDARANRLGDGIADEKETWRRRRSRRPNANQDDDPEPIEAYLASLRASSVQHIDVRDNGFDEETKQAWREVAEELRGSKEVLVV